MSKTTKTTPKDPTNVEITSSMMDGLMLGSEALESPRLIKTGWQEGQRFSEKSDPDRMNQEFVDKSGKKTRWRYPSFIDKVNPIQRRQLTSVTELQPPGNLDKYDPSIRLGVFARVVHNVLTEDECKAFISSVNDKGFTPALINTGGGNQTYIPDYRCGHRVIVDSPEFAQWLLEVLRPHLPAELPHRQASLSDINERCRVLCYTPGQFFAKHCDGQYRRPRNHPNSGDFSAITIQIYLHDVPTSHGGATTFLDPSPRCKDDPVPCQPRRGSILLFTQNLLHEGSLVTSGIKYTIRSEVMYKPV